jgi:hypothetical protein
MSKNKNDKSKHTKWSHHDTMIVNLRDWVNKEIHLMRCDVSQDAPQLEASVSKLLKSAEDLNIQMFDLIRQAADMAEKESKKKVEE